MSEIAQQAERGEIFEVVVVFATPDGATGYAMSDVSYITPMLGELRLVGDALSEQARTED